MASSPAVTHRPSLLEQVLAGGEVRALDDTESRVLDAATELFAEQGIQRTSMEEVARRAGVSRVTLYRRFATRDALVALVVKREFERNIARFVTDVSRADTVDGRVVAGFVSAIVSARENPMMGRLLRSETALITPTLDGSETLATVRTFVARQLRREQVRGQISGQLDVDLVAEMMVRLSLSFLTSPESVIDGDDPEQLADVARRFLVPMIHPG